MHVEGDTTGKSPCGCMKSTPEYIGQHHDWVSHSWLINSLCLEESMIKVPKLKFDLISTMLTKCPINQDQDGMDFPKASASTNWPGLSVEMLWPDMLRWLEFRLFKLYKNHRDFVKWCHDACKNGWKSWKSWEDNF